MNTSNFSLVSRLSTPRFYLAAVKKIHGCKIKSGRGKPGYKAKQLMQSHDNGMRQRNDAHLKGQVRSAWS